jgi:hypothetical protein
MARPPEPVIREIVTEGRSASIAPLFSLAGCNWQLMKDWHSSKPIFFHIIQLRVLEAAFSPLRLASAIRSAWAVALSSRLTAGRVASSSKFAVTHVVVAVSRQS